MRRKYGIMLRVKQILISILLFGFALSIFNCATVDLNGLDPSSYQGQTPTMDPNDPTSSNPFAIIDCATVDETFSTAVEPVFSTKCTGSGCHSTTSPAAGIDLDITAGAYTGTSLVPALQTSPAVDNINFFQSALILAPLDEAAGGISHPVARFNDASDAEFRALYCWLEGGMANDLDDSDFNFGDDIYGLFTPCAGCHESQDLKLTADDYPNPRAFHTALLEYVDVPGEAPASRLYHQATNTDAVDNHTGGEVFAPGSTQADQLLNWINNGAPAD